MHFRRALVLTLIAVALGAGGCELLTPSDVYQCSTDGDCAGRGGAFAATTCVNRTCVSGAADASVGSSSDGPTEAGGDAADGGAPDAADDAPWGCLGQVAWPAQSTTAKVLYRNRLLQVTTTDPIVGLQIIACGSFDPDCMSPVATTTTDDQGYFTLTLPQWFRGFLWMPTAPASYPDMTPTLMMLIPPPATDADVDASIGNDLAPEVLTNGEIVALWAVLGKQSPAPDAGFGMLSAVAVDCRGLPAPGVSIQTAQSVPNDTITYYIGADGTPTFSGQQTSPSGLCGFGDLPEGDDTITMDVFGQGKSVGQANVLIKSGYVTIAYLGPSP